MKKIKIAIADDHHLVRQGMKLMIQGFGNFEIICESSNGKELIEKIEMLNVKPDISIIDLSMPIMDGFETIRYLVKNHSQINCIALSMSNDFKTVFKVIDSGAKGYLTKDETPDIMKETLEEVFHSGKSYSSFVVDSLVKYQNSNSFESNNTSHNRVLSKREIEFVKYCCSELAYKQIADKMSVSNRTVDSYRESVFSKLNLKSRIGIVLYAVNKGIYEINI